MRRIFLTVALGLGLAALVGPGRAYAYGGERLQVHVPFAFHVEGTEMPAGQYLIERADPLAPQVMSLLSRDTGKERLFVFDNAYPDQPVKTPELVFDRQGNQRFLRSIWLPDASGAAFRVAPDEVHAARAAARAAEPTTPTASGMSR